MKLLEVYKYGFLCLFKIMALIPLELIFVVVLVIAVPLWWVKYVQKVLTNFGDVIEKMMFL